MKFNLRTIFLLLVAAAAAFASWRNLREADADKQEEAVAAAVQSMHTGFANNPGHRQTVAELPSGDPYALEVIRHHLDGGVPTHELPRGWGHHLPHLR